MSRITIALIIVLIFLVIIHVHQGVHACDDYIYGFWTAPKDFCEESEIDSMMIFFGPGDTGVRSTLRYCYIVITDDLCNQGFTLKYPRAVCMGGKYVVQAQAEFDTEDIWPQKIELHIDPAHGAMTIRAGKTIYARLVKNHEITNSVTDD